MGRRELVLTREIYIDRADFRETANKKYKRLVLGGEVRLRNAYTLICDEVIKEGDEIKELRCHYDPQTLGRNPEGRKVRGVIHWVSAVRGIRAEVCLYDRLFTRPDPDGAKEQPFQDFLNPDSLVVVQAVLEPSLAEAAAGARFQFEREGYFCRDSKAAEEGRLVFNRIVTLRDSWGKAAT